MDNRDAKRTEVGVAPSWSWVSVVGQVSNDFALWENKTKNTLFATFIRKEVEYEDDVFGKLKSDGNHSLVIQGQLVKGAVGEIFTGQAKQEMVPGAEFDSKDIDDTKTYALLLFGDAVLGTSKSANKFLGRNDLLGLMLLPVDPPVLLENGDDSGTFTRCEMFRVGHGEDTKRLRSAMKAFCADAKETGLPHVNIKGSNEFVVTII
ncbi:hypothetical protein BKA61DRAFT_672642 [Leptodontidium sp. MPI-SDFR-AT-0119]|nr:hypothetical protein BKA61DRAFT_672642 [Leptodontidium sp. MPI-SDFR-AT-0119]